MDKAIDAPSPVSTGSESIAQLPSWYGCGPIALAGDDNAFYVPRHHAPATPDQKAKLERLSLEAVKESELAGEPIIAKLSRAPGNDAPIGGIKVMAASGWFAARPSGTENLYKIYAESFVDQAHLDAIVTEARAMVSAALEMPEPNQAKHGAAA